MNHDEMLAGRCGSAFVYPDGGSVQCILGAGHKDAHTTGVTTWTDPKAVTLDIHDGTIGVSDSQ